MCASTFCCKDVSFFGVDLFDVFFYSVSLDIRLSDLFYMIMHHFLILFIVVHMYVCKHVLLKRYEFLLCQSI